MTPIVSVARAGLTVYCDAPAHLVGQTAGFTCFKGEAAFAIHAGKAVHADFGTGAVALAV